VIISRNLIATPLVRRTLPADSPLKCPESGPVRRTKEGTLRRTHQRTHRRTQRRTVPSSKGHIKIWTRVPSPSTTSLSISDRVTDAGKVTLRLCQAGRDVKTHGVQWWPSHGNPWRGLSKTEEGYICRLEFSRLYS
jgi:hypothetical protein